MTHYSDDLVTLHHGDCLDVLRSLPDNSVDSVVTDPPYGLEFMGKEWDSFKTGRGAKYASGGDLNEEAIGARRGKGGAGPSYVNRPAKRCRDCGKQQWSGSPCVCPEPVWVLDNSPLHSFQAWCEQWTAECLRVLKPGGHILAFGGTRTWHRLACAVEDAGFEVRDSIAWLYGSGFPKSLDVSKAIDKIDAADERLARARTFQAWLRQHLTPKQVNEATGTDMGHHLTTHPTQPAVATAALFDRLRPLLPEVPAVIEALVAQRTVESQNYAARAVVGIQKGAMAGWNMDGSTKFVDRDLTDAHTAEAKAWQGWGTALKPAFEPVVVARKPLTGTVAANVLAHGVGALNIDASRVGGTRWPANVVTDENVTADLGDPGVYYYVAKAPTKERPKADDGTAHPTVKPLTLMRWLVRLVTPPGGVVLEPFAGSGTTVEACLLEGFRCVAIERETTYLPLIEQRIQRVAETKPEPEPEPTLF